MLVFLKRAIPWFLAATLFATGWHLGSASKDAEWKQEVLNEYIKKDEANRKTQEAVNKVSRDYQATISEIEGSTDRIINDLRNSNKRLSIRVKTARSSKGNSGCFPDGRAELDERDAKRILAVTQKGDAWIKALQNTIKELQKEK